MCNLPSIENINKYLIHIDQRNELDSADKIDSSV